MPIGGLLKGPANSQGHRFVKSAAHDLQRCRQAIGRKTVLKRKGTKVQTIASAGKAGGCASFVDFCQRNGCGFRGRQDQCVEITKGSIELGLGYLLFR